MFRKTLHLFKFKSNSHYVNFSKLTSLQNVFSDQTCKLPLFKQHCAFCNIKSYKGKCKAVAGSIGICLLTRLQLTGVFKNYLYKLY